MDAFARGSYDTPTKALVNMTVRQLSVWGGSTQLLAEDLTAALHNRHACAVFAGTERAAMNVAADLKAAGLPAGYFESLSPSRRARWPLWRARFPPALNTRTRNLRSSRTGA